MKYDVNFWLRRRYCHLTSHFFNFSVISCTDEIRQQRYLEALMLKKNTMRRMAYSQKAPEGKHFSLDIREGEVKYTEQHRW